MTLAQRATWSAALAGVVAAIAVGSAVFQPWRLFTSTTVHEALPGTAVTPGPATGSTVAARPSPTSAAASTDTGRRTLASGTFISHEHRTSGQVRVLQLADGSRILRLEHLDTSDGPALHVWLSDQPVVSGHSGWGRFDDGAHLDLGDLKGNKGDQNYPVPAGVDLHRFSSVSIWCARFHVSFGASALSLGGAGDLPTERSDRTARRSRVRTPIGPGETRGTQPGTPSPEHPHSRQPRGA